MTQADPAFDFKIDPFDREKTIRRALMLFHKLLVGHLRTNPFGATVRALPPYCEQVLLDRMRVDALALIAFVETTDGISQLEGSAHIFDFCAPRFVGQTELYRSLMAELHASQGTVYNA